MLGLSFFNMATCQPVLLLKVASFSTFYEVALPGCFFVTETMSQDREQEQSLEKKQFKLRVLMGSFLLQVFSFQGMCSHRKKNTAKSKFDLFALPVNGFCLAFYLQTLALAKLPCNPQGLERCRAY